MPTINQRVLSHEELEQLYRATESERDYMLIKITVKHGLRNGEAVSLRKREIDAFSENPQLNIYEGKNDKDRSVPIPEDFVPELQIYLQQFDPHDHIFPSKRSDSHLTPRAFQKKMREYALEAELYPEEFTEEDVQKLPYQDRIVPHSLRHTYATRLIQNNVSLKKVSGLMGHEDIEVTADVYGNLLLEDAREDLNQITI